MAAAHAAENQGNEWGLTWYLQRGIYKSNSAWNHSQNSVPTGEALRLKISSYGIALKLLWRPSQSVQY